MRPRHFARQGSRFCPCGLGSSEIRREAIHEPEFVPIGVITTVEPEVHLAFMRKRLISPTSKRVRPHDEGWLDLNAAAVVEVTSEEEDYPNRVCAALKRDAGLACNWMGNSNYPASLR